MIIVEEELLLKKKKKKELSSHIEELEKLLEEDKADISKKIDALIEVLLQAASETDEEEAVLEEIRESLEEIKGILKRGPDTEALANRLEALLKEERSALLEAIKRMEDEQLLYLSDIKQSLEELKRSEGEREVLAKELASIKEIVSHISSVLDSDVERRKEALKKLRERLERIEESLATSRDDSSKELLEEIEKTKNAILYAISKLEDQEARELEVISSLLEEVREDMTRLLKAVEKEHELDTEKLAELEKDVKRLSRRVRTIINLSTKNSKALEKYAGKVAGLLSLLHTLESRIEEIKSLQKREMEIVESYKEDLFKRLDETLSSVLSQLRDLLLTALKERERSVDAELEELRELLRAIQTDMGNLLLLLKQTDVTSELKEIEEQLKVLSSRVERGIMRKEEVREALEVLEKRLDAIAKALPTEDLEGLKSTLKRVEEQVDKISKKLSQAGAVISHEDLKQIIRDLEELRVHARLLKDSGVTEGLEELYSKVKAFKEALERLPEETLHVSEDLEHIEQLLKEISEVASHIEEIAKEKAEMADRVMEHAERIGKSVGVVGSHILKKKGREIKKKSKLMMEIASIARKIDRKTAKIRSTIEKKTVKHAITTVDVEERIRRAIVDAVRRLRPGEKLDLKAFAEAHGFSYDRVKRVAREVVRLGEVAMALEKPLLPFLGRWYIKRL